MARKRKIPARKHHGIRDPLKQLEEKEKKLKHVVNNPPERGGNDQKASFKFQQFKKLADAAKAGQKIKRIHKGQEDRGQSRKNPGKAEKATSTAAGGANKYRNIKQFIDETDEDYLRRVNRITSESLKEAQYEAKYGVNVVRDPKTGMITIKKKPKNEIDELLKQKQKDRLNGKAKGKANASKKKQVELMDPQMAKELAKRAVRESVAEKRQELNEPSEYKQDFVKFGEVVHAPPAVLALPRKAQKSETVPRPGKKANLLLKSILDPSLETADTKPTTASTKTKPIAGKITKAQMKGKRKDLPAATRSMLESEQSKFIELYRNLKKAKIQQQQQVT